MGSGQCRRIINAVTHHGYVKALFLIGPYHCLFAVRQHSRHHIIGSHLRCNGSGRALIVTGQHNDRDPHLLQLLNGSGAGFLDDVRHSDHTKENIFTGKQQWCFSLSGQLLCFL